MSQQEVVALQVFVALSNYEDDFSNFLAQTGSDLNSLRETMQQPETLACVMDYVLDNEDLLLRICEDLNLSPNAIWKSRLSLPGSPGQVCWSA